MILSIDLNKINTIIINCINIKFGVGKMITVSLIIEYLYCPFKVYIQQINDFDILTNSMISGRMSHEALTRL